MLIQDINLTNFRNHSAYHLSCHPDTTLILGANGYGKTSVLEAIYILTRGKSFRATDPDILKRGAPFYRIEITYDTGESTIATYDGKNKTFKIADKTARRLPAKYKYPVVLFEPHDLNLVSGPPSRRRDYFDRIFSDFSEDYASTLSKFNKALKQRNELLKSEVLEPTSLFAWNVLLSNLGSTLASFRTKFLSEIERPLTPTYHSIADNSDEISVKYTTAVPGITESEYLSALEKSYDKDRILGYTSFGVQRDTIDFIFNQKPADGSASRGETRSIILALKFVEASLITSKLGKKPIILLDDVFSELDQARRDSLVSNFKDNQVIITSVEEFTL
ncbi:DNA replication and repair protein RecF [Candidatus Saccharibacteria bacterium]|nr:DNA replication and repair protein RecF [Candidatus Saccharibacteria bacterium]